MTHPINTEDQKYVTITILNIELAHYRYGHKPKRMQLHVVTVLMR